MKLIYAPKDTLAYHNSRIVHQSRDMGKLGVKKLMDAFKPRFTSMAEELATPEKHAVQFYGLNHAMALIATRHHPMEPLPAEVLHVVEQYHRTTALNAVRCWYYLLLICARETRHTHSGSTHWATFRTKFGDDIHDYFKSYIQGQSSGGVVQNLTSVNPPDVPLGRFTEAMAWNFHNGPFSGGYGGPKWGNVADCLDRFIRGITSCEIMMDTVWTLAHNGGPIFNKGMLFKNYGQNLYRILDVQRAGLIPEAVLFDPAIASKNSEMQSMMKWLKSEFPDRVGDYVDWVKVKALGAVGSYGGEIASQIAKHGASPATAAIEAAKLQAEHAATLKEQQAKALQFEVMPGLVISKIIRKKAA